MSEEKKTHKRKLLIRYLILAACILVIAAITVVTVFAVNDWFRADSGFDNVLDNPDDNKKPDDDKKPDDNPGGEDKPTDADNTFYKPVSALYVTKGYDFLANPSLKGQWAFHEGIDIEADAGTDVMSCLAGTVEKIVSGDHLDGNSVTVLHGNGLRTVYKFIDIKSGLKEGDSVARGEKIGTVAEAVGSEFLQGAHLHFEVIEKGVSVDPANFLDAEEK